jgi:hypothetical protein
MEKKHSKAEPIRLFDRENKLYVRIKLNDTTKMWERWISKTKNKWEMTHNSMSLADVIKFQEEIVQNNYRNFYKMLFKK